MNKFSTHLKDAADAIRLSDAEKRTMRTSLNAALFLRKPPVASPYRQFFFPRMAVYACMGLLMIGGGTAYAARGSLPGNVLYPVKIYVNEKVEVALSLSPEAKVKKNAEIALRRIEEVGTLAAKGTLSAEAADEATKDFKYHASEVLRFAKDSRHKKEAVALTKDIAASFDTLGATLLETEAEEMVMAAKASPAAEAIPKDFANQVRESAEMLRSIGIDQESEATTTQDSVEVEIETPGKGEGIRLRLEE